MTDETAFRLTLDTEALSYRYYRNAVERHWDPAAIDLDADRDAAAEMPDGAFDHLRATIAKFGAGERAVTKDLTPLAVALDDPTDQAFLSTQLYEEARHLEFFERYWREVITPAEERRGLATSDPTADRWINDAYDELLARTDEAMHRLLETDTPDNRAVALCHYHLTIESILAQTAYWGLQASYGPAEPELPTLPGFVSGLESIRADEGRHVGFGIATLQDLVAAGVDPQLLHDTVTDLLPLVQRTTTDRMNPDRSGETPGPSTADLQEYAATKHTERMAQIADADATLPSVKELVCLDDPDNER